MLRGILRTGRAGIAALHAPSHNEPMREVSPWMTPVYPTCLPKPPGERAKDFASAVGSRQIQRPIVGNDSGHMRGLARGNVYCFSCLSFSILKSWRPSLLNARSVSERRIDFGNSGTVRTEMRSIGVGMSKSMMRFGINPTRKPVGGVPPIPSPVVNGSAHGVATIVPWSTNINASTTTPSDAKGSFVRLQRGSGAHYCVLWAIAAPIVGKSLPRKTLRLTTLFPSPKVAHIPLITLSPRVDRATAAKVIDKPLARSSRFSCWMKELPTSPRGVS